MCPKSGKMLAMTPENSQSGDMPELDDLIAHLVRGGRLSAAEAHRVVSEVLAYLDERPEQYVCRRHRALQEAGLDNGTIFARLASELARWRFRAPDYSERQIRRLIYG